MELDMQPEPEPETAPDAKTLTPADRISELNEIDKSITQLLAAASRATSVLANPSLSDTRTLPDAEEAFRSASLDYFSTLSSIEVRLRRQVYALEEAGLIVAGTDRDARRGRTVTANADGEDSVLSNRRTAGGGALDPSWLNARVSDSVEVRKRMELLEEGKKMVDAFQGQSAAVKKENDNMDQTEG